MVLEEKSFEHYQCFFTIIDPLEKQIWINSKGWKLAKWLWRRMSLNAVNIFLLFYHFQLPLETGALIWKKLNHFHIYMYKKALCQLSLVKIDPVVLEKKIFKCCQCFRNIIMSISLGKWCSPYLNKFEFLLPEDSLRQVLVKLAQWFWRR